MATANRYLSYKSVIDLFFMKYPEYRHQFNLSDALEITGLLIEQLSIVVDLKDELGCIKITNGRGTLPCNLHLIIQTAKVDNWNENDIIPILAGTEGMPTLIPNFSELKSRYNLIPMRWSTDTFYQKYHKGHEDFNCESAVTYKVNGNYIFPNFETGLILMSYESIPIDKEGFPLIPDRPSLKLAIVHNIALNLAGMQFRTGQLPEAVFRHIEGERNFYVAQAVNSSHIPIIDEMESMTNGLNQLVDSRSHRTMFANMQLPQQLNINRY